MGNINRGNIYKKFILALSAFLLLMFPVKAQVEALTPEWYAITTARIIATHWAEAIYGEPVDCFNYGDYMLEKGVIAYCYETQGATFSQHRDRFDWLITNTEGANFISNWVHEAGEEGAYRLFTFDPLPGHVFTIYVLAGSETNSTIGMVTGLPPGFI